MEVKLDEFIDKLFQMKTRYGGDCVMEIQTDDPHATLALLRDGEKPIPIFPQEL